MVFQGCLGRGSVGYGFMNEQELASAFTNAAKAQWATLVSFRFTTAPEKMNALIESLTEKGWGTKQSFVMKFRAIESAHNAGLTMPEIVEKGQSAILSMHAIAKKNGHTEKQKMLRWRVSASLADAIMSSETSPDQEEALATRLVRVCGLKTSEEFWEFINSVFADWSDADLLHHAGEATGKRGKR